MKSLPGRPKGASKAREQLTQAARELFLHTPYEQVSIRQIARTAGVDSSLIRYYFGDKAGLFETMVRETIAPIVAILQANKSQQNKDQMDLETLISTYYRILGANPALPKLIFRVLNDNPNSDAFAVLARISVVATFARMAALARTSVFAVFARAAVFVTFARAYVS